MHIIRKFKKSIVLVLRKLDLLKDPSTPYNYNKQGSIEDMLFVRDSFMQSWSAIIASVLREEEGGVQIK